MMQDFQNNKRELFTLNQEVKRYQRLIEQKDLELLRIQKNKLDKGAAANKLNLRPGFETGTQTDGVVANEWVHLGKI